MKYKLIKYKRPVPWNRDEGAALVLLALMLVILMGFAALVVDMGRLSVTKRKLVAAADAAALAGAHAYANEMLTGTGNQDVAKMAADACAKDYARRNDLDPSEVLVSLEEVGTGLKVTVDVNREMNLSFAPVLGVDRGKRAAHAAAITGPLGGVKGLSPVFVLSVPDYVSEIVLSHEASEWIEPGDYGYLVFTKQGDFTEQLKLGYEGYIQIGDIINTGPGISHGQVKPAITEEKNKHKEDARFERCAAQCGTVGGCTHDNHGPDCPRLVVILICHYVDKHQVQVDGFASCFLVSYEPSEDEDGGKKDKGKDGQGHGHDELKAVFLKRLAEGEVDPTAADGGNWAVNLVE